ncbi:MAG: TonB-dependent receptor [Saonia sp.]
MKPFFFLFISFTVLSVSIAQEKKNDSITQLEEVILLDAAKNLDATGITPSERIGPTTFQNYSPIDMVAAINQISGVYILSGALNTNRITIRGVGARTPFGTDKLRLYYNGIPVTNGTGSSTIEAFDLENLNSIEVVKGPKGSAYGANLGGAILLRSNTANTDSNSFTNNFTLGSYNLIKDNLSFKHKDAKLSLALQYNHLETDGYRENNRFERDGILLSTSYRFNAKNEISFLLNYIDYTAQIPSTLSQTSFDENPRQAAANWLAAQGFETNKYTLLGLSYSYKFSDRFKNTTSLFYTYLDHYEPRPFNILDEFTNGYGFRTQFSGDFSFIRKAAAYTFGAELYTDEYNWGTFENLFSENNGNGSLQGDRISDNKEFRRQFNAFGTITIPLTESFMAQVGLNINKTHYDFRDLFNTGANNRNAIRSFDAILLPSFTLNYSFSKALSLYANISRGFSNPSLEETLTPDGVINPDIEQEIGINYELGTKLLLMDKKLNLAITMYQMDIKNLLVAQRVGEDQFIGKNAGSTRHQGLELSATYDIFLSPNLRMGPFVNYTFNDHSFVNFVDDDEDFSGNPLTGVPKHRINSGIQLQHSKGFYWNTTHQFVDEIPLTDANTLSSEAFTLFNTRIGGEKQLSEKFMLGLDFGINNLFNIRYAQSVLINAVGFGGAEPRYFYPGNARNYYGSLRLKYQL